MVRLLLILVAVLPLAGCQSREVRTAADIDRLRQAGRLMPPVETTDPPVPPPAVPKNVLVLSGGGMYGAYTAGFLAGWSNTRTRPPFDVVTGVSTGSLIACAAFLGPPLDPLTREFYTTVRAADIYTERSWVTVPFADAVASSKPLRQIITTVVDEPFLKSVAAEHRKGRRLYVGTTSLATRKLVIWDMGAIAARNDVGRFREVLLASCSVPGMLPPVALPDARTGKPEWHADGGVAAPLFVPPGLVVSGPGGQPSGTNVYVLVAGKLFADPEPVKPKVLNVLAASAVGVVYAHTRSEVAGLFHLTRATGGQFHMAAVPASDNGDTLGLGFDPKEMGRLYEVGYTHGTTGPAWMTAPPFDTAATDPPRE